MAQSELFAPPLPWYERPFAVLDFEATSVDPFTARPVSFAYAIIGADNSVIASFSAIIQHLGLDIPEEAIAVHGITTERMRAEGIAPKRAMELIAAELVDVVETKMPLVIMNCRYDWPLLLAEAKRQGVIVQRPTMLLDPGLLDKGCDKYRKGKRKLTDLCERYGVTLTAAHDASADAIAAAQLARAILDKYRWVRNMSAIGVEGWEARVFEEYRSFLCRDGSHTITKGWPIPEQSTVAESDITAREREDKDGTTTEDTAR